MVGTMHRTFGHMARQPMGRERGEALDDARQRRHHGQRHARGKSCALWCGVVVGVAAPMDSYCVEWGALAAWRRQPRGNLGGVSGSEGEARAHAWTGNNHAGHQQGVAGTTLRRVGCAAYVAVEGRAGARPGGHKNNNALQGPIVGSSKQKFWRSKQRAAEARRAHEKTRC